MLQNWPPERKRPHVVEFVLPDIYAALPDRCVRQVVDGRGGSFPGWRQVVKDFAGVSGIGFKDFFVAQSGLPPDTDTTKLLVEILDRCRIQPRVELRRAMQEVVDRVRAEGGSGQNVD